GCPVFAADCSDHFPPLHCSIRLASPPLDAYVPTAMQAPLDQQDTLLKPEIKLPPCGGGCAGTGDHVVPSHVSVNAVFAPFSSLTPTATHDFAAGQETPSSPAFVASGGLSSWSVHSGDFPSLQIIAKGAWVPWPLEHGGELHVMLPPTATHWVDDVQET